MRKFILIMALLFSNLMANALTIDKLLKNYRNQPDIQYEVIKGKELKALIDSVSSETEKDALRSARKLVILGSRMDEIQHESLSSYLNRLDDYSLALSYSIDTQQKTLPLLGIASGTETSINVDIYSKKSSSGEYLNKPVFLINMWGMVVLAYLDGRIKPDIAKDLIQVTFSNSDSRSESAQKHSAIDRINIQRNIYPQEKIHVVTDRNLYCGGDTIWLRAFVVDADSHIQTAISKYAYVELLNPFGYANKRVKLMESDGVYAGYIPVDEEIYEGDYTLTAYTAYAENQGKDFFFRKPLRILAPQSSKYVIDSEFAPSGEGKVNGLFKIRSLTGGPINYKVMSWTMPDGDFLEIPHAKKGVSRKEGVMVSAIVPKKNFGTFADTDSDGIFHLRGFDFPEGTPFILKAMNEKGGLEANYDIFEDRFPETECLPHIYPSASTEDITDFFKGSRWILLDEVKVQAFKESNDDIYANFSSYSRTADDMKVRGITSVDQALRGIGGITNHMGHLKWRYQEISYYVDGQLFDPRGNATLMYNVAGQPSPWIRNADSHNVGGNSFYGPTLSEVAAAVPFNMIERIDFICPEHSLVLGPSYGGPTVVITTKKGDKVRWERQFELKDHLPLGYQEYKEYASPLLSVDTDEYDLETKPTLLWLPSVRFDDAGKSIDLKFPVKPEYRVIIEGLSDNGDIISETL